MIMKKLITMVAVVATAGVVSAQVYSDNIVGYSQQSLGAGSLLIVSSQFTGDAGSTTLGAAFSDVAGNSKVYIWTGSGYTIGTYFAGYGWFDAGFANLDGTVLNAGTALWIEDAGAGSSPLALGEVPAAASIDVALNAGLTMIANPYPVEMLVGEIPTAGLAGGEKIYIWTGSGYTIGTYFAGYGWFDAGFASLASVPVPVGQGLWLESAGGTMTFSKSF
jgi:hypothetical protein